MNILLIEDDAGLVELITTMFEDLGFSVTSASSGAEALAHLKKQTCDMMLLDYSLPDFTGKELIETIHKQQIATPPFIITTGQGDERIAVNMMKLGAMDYVVKDILFLEKLPDVVKRVIKEIESKEKLKQVEDKLKESELKFRALYDNAPLSYQSLNEEGIFRDVNPMWLDTLGYDRDEVIGKFYKDFLHPAWQPHFEENFPRFKKLGYVHDVYFKIRHKDGHYLDIQFEGCIGYNPDGSFKQTYCVFQDVTERKKAEDKTRSVEENLKNTFDISPSIISKANIDTGYFIEANSAVTRILGYSVKEFTSKPLMEFIHPDDRHKTADEITEQQTGKVTTFFENRYLCKDGSYKWMAWNATKADKNGIVTAIASDISERKIVEQEIIKTKKFYENITEAVQDGIWVTDKNDIIFYANSAMEKIAGVPREQIQGNNILIDFDNETTGEIIDFYKKAKKEKKPVWYDIKVKTPGNRITWQNGWLIPQYQKNVYAGMICTIRDVTERKRAEGSVRRLSTAVQQSPSIVVISDTKGKLEYVNPKFTDITGYSSTEAIGAKSNILKSGEQDSTFYKEMWDTVNSGKVWRGQFRNKKKNGELFWEVASISAIFNESGDVINFIKIGEDITQQKINETELKNALEKALESDRLKSSFLANMSHEIRTPMNGILGFINLLNKPDLSQAKISEYSEIINKSGDRLLNTINDIINISKIEAGEIVVSNTETSINSIMDELHSFYSPEANLRGLSLSMAPSLTTEQATVITDSHKLFGILTNLIKNAIKYTETGSVKFGYILKENTEPVVLEFYVKDTGIGIPENRKNAIFNRFEQADIEDSRVFEGSGLGLAISKAYVEMLGGEIFVHSEEGKGSTFTFTLPYDKEIKIERKQESKNLHKEALKIANLNLLIVEDDEVSSELLEAIFEDTFRKILFVRNGAEAVHICRNNPEIDLVLMDLKMPKMNGYEATRLIRKFNKKLLIIAQTAYVMPFDELKALEAGCNDYISKPINKELLLKMINKYIG